MTQPGTSMTESPMQTLGTVLAGFTPQFIEALNDAARAGWITDDEAKTFVHNVIQNVNNTFASLNQGTRG